MTFCTFKIGFLNGSRPEELIKKYQQYLDATALKEAYELVGEGLSIKGTTQGLEFNVDFMQELHPPIKKVRINGNLVDAKYISMAGDINFIAGKIPSIEDLKLMDDVYSTLTGFRVK